MGDASRVRIVYGRKDADGIKELISGMDAVIDATHPYAKEVTGLIFKACSDCGIAYYRYARPKSELDTHVIPFASKQEAIGYLSGTEGNILLTTGAKELTDYAVLGSERLYVRVLPMPDSLAACYPLCGSPQGHPVTSTSIAEPSKNSSSMSILPRTVVT